MNGGHKSPMMHVSDTFCVKHAAYNRCPTLSLQAWLQINFIVYSPSEPVTYTHLDVYKRQM